MKLENREIVYCNIKFTYNKKDYELKEVVYKNVDGYYHNIAKLLKLKIKESVKITEIEIIKRLGFEVGYEKK